MAIEITCPNGHNLKVKDKYAGKTGLCPYCKQRVAVPKAITDADVAAMLSSPSDRSQRHHADDEENDDTSVLDHRISGRESSSMSLLGGSAVRHTKRCPNCSEDVPYWFATCPRCEQYLSEHDPFGS